VEVEVSEKVSGRDEHVSPEQLSETASVRPATAITKQQSKAIFWTMERQETAFKKY
jgi:hypothetical protein